MNQFTSNCTTRFSMLLATLTDCRFSILLLPPTTHPHEVQRSARGLCVETDAHAPLCSLCRVNLDPTLHGVLSDDSVQLSETPGQATFTMETFHRLVTHTHTLYALVVITSYLELLCIKINIRGRVVIYHQHPSNAPNRF